MNRWIALGLACGLLLACSQADDAASMSKADEQQAAKLLRSFQSASRDGNWQAAESLADQLRERYPESEASASLGQTLETVRKQAAAARELQRLSALWEYQAVQAADGVQRSAAIYSRTVPAVEGELVPVADARLVLRDHPAWGRSAYLLLEQSKFRCGSPCTLGIRFDGNPAQTFAGRQADSGQGPALFIKDEEQFVRALAKSRTLRIELPRGSGRLASLSFDVGGFDPSRYAHPGATSPR
jgi:hypothetical protein